MSAQKKRRKAGPRALIAQSASGRWYADLRAYRDVLRVDERKRGVALVPPGATLATTDYDVALHLYNARVAELEGRRKDKTFDPAPSVTLGSFIPRYLELRAEDKAEARRPAKTERELRWLKDVVFYRATEFFGADRKLKDIRPVDVRDWLRQLRIDPGPTRIAATAAEARARHVRKTPDPRSEGGLSKATMERHRWGLHALFQKACFLELTPRNPVAMQERTRTTRKPEHQRRALTAADAALLLEAASLVPLNERALGHAPEAIAVMLLAGLRLTECRGLFVGDVDWEHRKLRVRENEHRDLKTTRSTRVVPIFPQLAELLRPYWQRRALVGGPDALLFPGGASDERGDRMVSNVGWRDHLAKLCTLIGCEPALQHELRHTFITYALQLTRGGMPIQPGDVRKWSGHSSAEIQAIYDHLVEEEAPRRGEHLEFRLAHYLDDPAVAARYAALRRSLGLPELGALGSNGGSKPLTLVQAVA